MVENVRLIIVITFSHVKSLNNNFYFIVFFLIICIINKLVGNTLSEAFMSNALYMYLQKMLLCIIMHLSGLQN